MDKLTRENFKQLPLTATDGAWGTELMKLGGASTELKDLWNVSAPDKVLQVARSYVNAGARIILTNTFSSNRITLERHRASGRSAELSRAGAAISRQAAADRALVFGSIGPTGKLVSLKQLDIAQAEAVFAEQAVALAAGGADALVIETMADLEEAKAALRACLRACDLPVGVSFTFDSGKEKNRTMMGVTAAQAWKAAREGGASFVGANCGIGIDAYVKLARELAQCGSDLPLWIKGNAGRPVMAADGSSHYNAGPEDFSRAVPELVAAGVRFIGGCCGSTPAHVAAIVAAIEDIRPSQSDALSAAS
ncbi:MAG TPA: homocysteine S-methyltransferase family protein [Rhodocyclaceae bacterium]|nr:homocysteine S-methyltransferase family protein [Rhodocyclaceae bacterium]